MVTQFTARLHRWRCLFYSNLQLAWFARVVVSKFLASRIIAASVDLSRRLFCALELVCWSDCATQFPGFVAKFAEDRKSTRLNFSHLGISYAVFCLKKKKK